MSLLTLAVPVFAVASAAIFLDESVTWVQVFGMLIVLGALSVVAVRASRQVPTPTPPLQSEAL
jgi:drug/metabolite transporter (DMT)-like permease